MRSPVAFLLLIGCASSQPPVVSQGGYVGACKAPSQGNPRLVIARGYAEDPRFRLIETKFFVDGAPVFESSDAERLRTKLEVVDDRPTTPGKHDVIVQARLRYFRDSEDFTAPLNIPVEVKPAGGTCLTVTLTFRDLAGLDSDKQVVFRINNEGSSPGSNPFISDELGAQVAECQRTPSEGCVKEAAALLRAHGGEARRILSAACDANIASGCGELGMALREGGALPVDAVKGDELLAKACKLDPGYCD